MASPPSMCWYYQKGSGFARNRAMIWREIELTETYMDHLSQKVFHYGWGRLYRHLILLNRELSDMVNRDLEVKFCNKLITGDALVDR